MKRDTKVIAAVLAAIPIVFLSAALLCTFAIAHGASPNWRVLFRIMCHGLPARSLTLWNQSMPICARCTAFYAGMLASVVVFAIARVRVEVTKWMLLAASAAMALDGLTQAVALRESTNPLRVATGLAVGITFGIWALATIEKGPANAVIGGFNAS